MIDLCRETNGNNEICLGVRFALWKIKSSTTRSYWALFLGRWSPFFFFILCKSLLHHVVEHCLPLPGVSRNGISLTSSFLASHSRTTTLKKRWISSCGHDGRPVSSRRARPARSVLDFSLCFQLSCFFFVFFLFLLLIYFLPSSSLFSFFFSIFLFLFLLPVFPLLPSFSLAHTQHGISPDSSHTQSCTLLFLLL